MTARYREFVREVGYLCPIFESVLLVRTTQRRLGLSRAALQRGETVAVATYGQIPSTPFADAVVVSLAWYPADGDVPWRWLRG